MCTRIFTTRFLSLFLVSSCSLLGGCEARNDLTLDLLPATSTKRIEAAVTLPGQARLTLEWEPSRAPRNGRGSRLEVWVHRGDERAELLHEQVIESGSPGGSVTLELGEAGEPVLVRALSRGASIEWTTATLSGRSPAEDAEEWRVRPVEGAPDVIVYLIDTLRPDVLAAYGGATPTPTFDRLAAEGTVFTRAYSTSSWTRPAVASLFSGLSTEAHRVSTAAFSLPEEVSTLAERFRLRGYQTVGVVSNGHVSPAFNFDQGFEIYTSPPKPPEPEDKWDPEAVIDHNSAEEVHAMVRSHLEERRDHDRPLFLYVHTVDPHSPYNPPRWLLPEARPDLRINHHLFRKINREGPSSPTELEEIALAYRGAVAYADAELGRLLTDLEPVVDVEDVVLVVTSDHGEAFREHGLMGHRHWIHEELIRIPLFVRAPGMEPGARVDTPASIMDLLPTVLELAGVEWASEELGEGASLASQEDGGAGLERALVSQHAEDHALIRGEWKLTHRHTPDGRQRFALFDIVTDPLERKDLMPENQGVGNELMRALRRWRFGVAQLAVPALPVDQSTVPAAVIENLQALGYID